mmetsp:Transcript_27364/g.50768  ORF Transcript_27364/g.50768 Transcript_27364/m.50768 type:complete len:223 (-) Transcript_27364:453-1121(-)
MPTPVTKNSCLCLFIGPNRKGHNSHFAAHHFPLFPRRQHLRSNFRSTCQIKPILFRRFPAPQHLRPIQMTSLLAKVLMHGNLGVSSRGRNSPRDRLLGRPCGILLHHTLAGLQDGDQTLLVRVADLDDVREERSVSGLVGGDDHEEVPGATRLGVCDHLIFDDPASPKVEGLDLEVGSRVTLGEVGCHHTVILELGVIHEHGVGLGGNSTHDNVLGLPAPHG